MSHYLWIALGTTALLLAGGAGGWMLAIVADGDDGAGDHATLIDAQRAIVVPTAETSRKLVVSACPPADAEIEDAVPSSGVRRPNTLVLPPDWQTRTVLVPACGIRDGSEVDETPGGRIDAQRDTRAGILLLPPGVTVAGTGDEGTDRTDPNLRPESVLVVPSDSEATVIRVPRCREPGDVTEHVVLSDPDGDGVIHAPRCGVAETA